MVCGPDRSSLGRAACCLALQCPGHAAQSGYDVSCACRARPMRRLANRLAVLHDPWRFGYVRIEIRTLMCGMLCALIAVRKAVVERVHWSCSRVCEKIRTCVCAELGSTFELEHDLRCFEHVLTHSNRLVWFC